MVPPPENRPNARPTARPTALPPGSNEHAIFASLFDAYPDALLLVDQRGLIVLANPAAAALLGYTAPELVGLAVDALVPEAIRPRHAAYRDAYARAPRARPMGMDTRTQQMELVARRRDGSQVMVEIALSPLQDHGLPFVVAAVRGIGAYPRVQQALQRASYSEHLAQLARLAVDARNPQELIDQVPGVATAALKVEAATVCLLERDRLFLRVAAAVGAVPGEDVGAQIANQADSPAGWVLAQGLPLIVEDYRLEQRIAVPPAYLGAGLVSALLLPISDRGRMIGTLAVHARSARRFGGDELRFLGSLASLLASSVQRALAEEALNHAQRLESVGQLTGGIAHDFNNLLTVIQGNLQVLEDLPALAGDGHGQQLIAAAIRAARRSAELTGKLLAFSRRQVLLPRPVDVGALLLSLADMLRRTLDQRIVITVETADACPLALADPGQLEASLLNIAINARDAMPDGGRLGFCCKPCALLPAAAQRGIDSPGASAAASGPFVAITVSDSGHGMAEAVKEHAFEPFFTTKDTGRGTGLGLSTVYGFVAQSSGGIVIDSAPGAGTAVTLYIPQAAAGLVADADAVEAAAPPVLPPGLNVLLVEDDAEVRQVVRALLVQLGCEVTTAASAEQALAALDQGLAPQVLLSDIALGAGIRGTALAALAQRRLPALAVLLMSGFSAELLEADHDAPPDWELLQKPYSRDALALALTRLTKPGTARHGAA